MIPSYLSQEERRLGSELLGMALCDLCPHVIIIHTDITPLGFFCDFIIKESFTKEFFVSLEERMRQIAKEEPEVKVLEMVPQSAAALLKHNKKMKQAKLVSELSCATVELIQIQNYLNVLSGPVASSFDQQKAYKILEIVKVGQLPSGDTHKNVFRLTGLVSDNNYDLKKLLQFSKDIVGKNHLCKAVHEGYCLTTAIKNYEEPTEIFWTGTGEEVRQNLLNFCRELRKESNFEMVVTPFSRDEYGAESSLLVSHLKYIELLKFPEKTIRLSETRSFSSERGDDLYDPKDFLIERAHIYCLKKDLLKESISSLQFIQKMSRMLCFECKWILLKPHREDKVTSALHEDLKKACRDLSLQCEEETAEQKTFGNRIELRVKDLYGRFWPVSFVEVISDPYKALAKYGIHASKGTSWPADKVIIAQSALDSLERIIALLLEQEDNSVIKNTLRIKR